MPYDDFLIARNVLLYFKLPCHKVRLLVAGVYQIATIDAKSFSRSHMIYPLQKPPSQLYCPYSPMFGPIDVATKWESVLNALALQQREIWQQFKNTTKNIQDESNRATQMSK